MRLRYLSFLLFLAFISSAQPSDTLRLLFMGDIMGHQPQFESAFDPATKSYSYTSVFSRVKPIIESSDLAIANLEVTLAGPPYTGYPTFSSPDALASAIKEAGIDILTTSNNHSCDRGKRGIIRTLDILDSFGLKHTGTFRDSLEKVSNNLLIHCKESITIGMLNYTYGTNGIKIPASVRVNLIDTTQMLEDIRNAHDRKLDKLIVLVHWGEEYMTTPSSDQTKLAEFLFNHGVDIVIGSHPHVLQRFEYYPAQDSIKEKFIAYSLGNFISNQRTRNRDGGAMCEITLVKSANQTRIADSGYYLTWVNRPLVNGKYAFEIIPLSISECNGYTELDGLAKDKIRVFASDSRKLFEKQNVNVFEILSEN